MSRVTPEEVGALIETEREIDPFIETADLIVTEDLAGLGYSTGRLRQIELYLSAHFVAIAEERGGLTSSAEGSAKETYQGLGDGLALTRFGQQVVGLDTEGVLVAKSSTALKAQLQVV